MSQTLTSTEIRTWNRCKMLHWWVYRAGDAGCGIRTLEEPEWAITGRFVHWFLAGMRTSTERAADGSCKVPQDIDQWPEWKESWRERPSLIFALYRALGMCWAWSEVSNYDSGVEWVDVEQEFEFAKYGIRFAGVLDGLYKDENGMLILQDDKYVHWKKEPPFEVWTSPQLWLYATYLAEDRGCVVTRMELNLLPKLSLKPHTRGEKESMQAFALRISRECIKDAENKFRRQVLAVSPSLVETAFDKIIFPAASKMAGEVPYPSGFGHSCVRNGSPCDFLPLCNSVLTGGNGLDEPELRAKYVDKEKKHVELKHNGTESGVPTEPTGR